MEDIQVSVLISVYIIFCQTWMGVNFSTLRILNGDIAYKFWTCLQFFLDLDLSCLLTIVLGVIGEVSRSIGGVNA